MFTAPSSPPQTKRNFPEFVIAPPSLPQQNRMPAHFLQSLPRYPLEGILENCLQRPPRSPQNVIPEFFLQFLSCRLHQNRLLQDFLQRLPLPTFKADWTIPYSFAYPFSPLNETGPCLFRRPFSSLRRNWTRPFFLLSFFYH